MTTGAPQRLGKFLGWAFAGLAGMVVAVFLVAWSGIFNVAASRGHWAVVDWFLAFGMRNSLELRAYPRLPGQNAAYMAGQLRLRKAGHHTSSDSATIMAPISQRLSDDDVSAVTTYLSGLGAAPARASQP